MLHDIRKHPTNPEVLVFSGSPSELAFFCDGSTSEADYSVSLGGLQVSDPHRAAKHDGKPAIGFTLSDEMGQRPIGRLVLLDTDDWHEEIPEWEIWYVDEANALENFEIFSNRSKIPAGWREIKARQLENGMTMADPDLYPEEAVVSELCLMVGGEDTPFTTESFPSGIVVAFREYSDPFDSEAVVWVKQ